jgi:toxin ParE1/3/4
MEPGIVIISVPAQADLLELWRYIAPEEPEAADRMVDLLLDRAQILASMREAGRDRPELGEGIRSFPVERYVLLYRATEKGIAIVRIIHSAQGITNIAEEGGFE